MAGLQPLPLSAQELLGTTITEVTLTALLAAMAFTLAVVLVLYRNQRRLTALLLAESRTDYLTQVPNRRYFLEQLASNVARAERYQEPLCLLMLDVDLFKSVNDRFGHGGGDVVLKAIASALQEQLRRSDDVGRLGGEEFGVQLPMTEGTAALAIAERLRQRIAELQFTGTFSGLAVSCSVGVAAFSAGMSAETLLAAADTALYRAKDSGRNRVVAAANETGQPLLS
ncbi:MAG: hypothetical protein CME43_14625 [Haliea sp.]|uniref:GGDEF domain-containing protein n=1 Tax=Haliea sp. TaxID=1932666 RepID=UPI000C5BD1E1|nr:GGDEF domain-containing protein [Haliea sp.]MBM70700.1 hypothetical protein [Haliea sp.]|tara:strand:+ start:22059 stop:22739 length:681 start_codon:yes stop_codon:yes gene_type:complete